MSSCPARHRHYCAHRSLPRPRCRHAEARKAAEAAEWHAALQAALEAERARKSAYVAYLRQQFRAARKKVIHSPQGAFYALCAGCWARAWYILFICRIHPRLYRWAPMDATAHALTS
jgi:hypothetical protein